MSNPKGTSMYEKIKEQQKSHEDQFDIATSAALQRGFGRWFDDTWTSARAKGALPNPFISSMFVFITTVLLKKFINGFAKDMPLDHQEMAIADAKRMMVGYLDQIEASAIKDIHTPKPESDRDLRQQESGASGGKSKQTIILPKKKRFVQ